MLLKTLLVLLTGFICYYDYMKWVIGIDEVGRGPVAGPVAVCACAIPLTDYKKRKWPGLTDSKKMTSKNRLAWYKRALELKQKNDFCYAVVYRSASFIDRKGISIAIRECISEALKKFTLDPKDCLVLLDGSLKAPLEYKNQKTIIKGDSEQIISFASVIAKVSRDKKMELLHKKYPSYNWTQNKGYGTEKHYRAIGKYGQTQLHKVL